MKAEFELNLDSNGRPCIKFRHYDKHGSLEQKAIDLYEKSNGGDSNIRLAKN